MSRDDKTKASELDRMVERVEAEVEAGNVPQAKAAFTRGWRDAVPDLPLRFSVILERSEQASIDQLMDRLRKNKGRPPQLALHKASSKRTQVQTARGKKLVLGELPRSDVKLLAELGRDARLYRPQLLEVRHDEQGSIRYVAIQMVRPELHLCPSCGAKHSDPYVQCSSCRRKQRTKQDISFEHTPVQIHEAIDAVVSENEGDGRDPWEEDD